MMETEYVKVHFYLNEQEEGFPPVANESLNGILISENLVKLDNTPFFIEEISLGDIVRVSKSGLNYFFESVSIEGTSKALSIILIDEALKESLKKYLENKGCYVEFGEFGALKMLAIEVNCNVDYENISNYLNELESKELISYSELCL